MTDSNASASSTQEPSGDATIDLRAQLRIAWTHRWLILAAVLLVGGGVAFWTMRQPRIYEATCSLEYDPSPPRPLGNKVEDVSGSPMLTVAASREFYETQNRIIASRTVAEIVVRRLGLHRDPDFMGVPREERDGWQGATVESAAQRVQASLTVTLVRDTRLVLVQVRDPSPERAQRIANGIADAYIEKTINDRMSSTISAVEWLGTQVDDLQGALRQADAALHAFKAEHDVLSLSLEDRQNLIANEMELFSRSLTQTRVHRIELTARVRELEAAVTGDPLTSGNPALTTAGLESLRAQLRTKVAELEALRTRYGPNHPQILSVTHEADQLRAELIEGTRAVLASAEAELREARQTEGGLRAALEQANQRGIELNRWEMEYGHLVRERDSKAALYDLVLKRSSETDLTRMLRITNVRMVDRAIEPRGAVAPRVLLNISIGLAAGLVLGMLLALILERTDRRIRSVEDVEAQGATVLGVIPKMAGGAASGRGRRRRQVAEVFERDLIAHKEPMSAIAENFRTVRTNLAFMGGDGKLGAFAITSPSPREGKSTVVLNLAISLAQSGKKIVIVDTDLRRPRLHRAFKISSARGITTCLANEAEPLDVVVATEIPNVDIVPCGPIPPNPSELLYTERFRVFLRALRERYDHVIFDSPPIGAVTDAAVLGAQLDGVLVVVKPHSTTRDGLHATLRQLRDVSARIIGAIVNDVDGAAGRGGEGYYYYRKAGYYAAEEASAGAAPAKN